MELPTISLLVTLILLNVVLPFVQILPRNQRIPLDIKTSLLLIGAGVTGWQASLIFTFYGNLASFEPITLVRFAFTFAPLLMFGILLFSFSYPTPSYPRTRSQQIWYYSISVALVLGMLSTLLTPLVVADYTQEIVTFGVLGGVYQITVILTLGSILYRFIARYRHEKKSQEYYKYLLLLMIFLIPAAFIFNFLLPLVGYTQFVLAGAFVFSSIGIFVGYTLSRPRLYTLGFVVQRLLYSVLFAIILFSGYWIAVWVSLVLTGQQLHPMSIVATFFLAFIFALGIEYIRPHLRRSVEVQLFHKIPKLDLQRMVTEEINNVSTPDEIVFIVQQLIERFVPQADVSIVSWRRFFGQKQIKAKKGWSLLVVDELSGQRQLKSFLLKQQALLLIVALREEKEVQKVLLVKSPVAGNLNMPQELFDILLAIQPNIEAAIQRSLLYEKISKFAVSLSQKVKLRTAEVLAARDQLKDKNEELLVAYAELQSLDKAKSDFISMASHQLKTPISIARGYISMLLEEDFGQVTTEQKQLLEKAGGSIKQLNTIVDDILNASRIEQGRLFLNYEKSDLIFLGENAAHELEHKAQMKGLTLKIDKKEKGCSAMVDGNKLFEVFMNIIDNAVSYTNSGEVRVVLSCDAKHFLFEVIDTGIGIPIAQQEKIFQRFSRAENAKKIRPDGSGIGLYIAKVIVEAHGGKIGFESTEGKGSRFWVRLPMKVKQHHGPIQTTTSS